MGVGKGLSVNLYGPSGTGKTITSHAIANSLNKKILFFNYGEIESTIVEDVECDLENGKKSYSKIWKKID